MFYKIEKSEESFSVRKHTDAVFKEQFDTFTFERRPQQMGHLQDNEQGNQLSQPAQWPSAKQSSAFIRPVLDKSRTRATAVSK